MALDHDGGPAAALPSRVVAEWPAGSFLENLVLEPEGTLLVTVHSDRAVDRVEPRTGAVTRVAQAPVPLAGLARAADGTVWASGGVPGTAPGTIWRLPPGGSPELWHTLPEALFLNGLSWAADGRTLLVAESLGGCIFAIDTGAPGHRVWLAHDLLRPSQPGATPGANGIRLRGTEALISVTERSRVLRVPVGGDGAAGAPAIAAERLRADDFAVAADGTLYVATHPANSVVRLSPDGTRRTVATEAQGAVNPTSCALDATQRTLFVTTTGGVFAPLPGGLQPARLLRLEIASAG